MRQCHQKGNIDYFSLLKASQCYLLGKKMSGTFVIYLLFLQLFVLGEDNPTANRLAREVSSDGRFLKESMTKIVEPNLT